MSTAPRPRRLALRGNGLVDTWTICKRRMRNVRRKPFVVYNSLLQPIIWLVLFTQVFEQIVSLPGFEADSYLKFFLPAVMVMLGLIASSFAGIGLVEDIENGMFEKMLATPMSRPSIFLGKTIADAAQITIQAVIVLVLGLLLGANIAAGVLGAIGLLVVTLLFSLWFIALSSIIAVRTEDSEATTTIGAGLSLPILLVSNAFMPTTALPDWIQTVSRFNPITYGVSAGRTIVLDGWLWADILPAVAVLLVLDLVLGAVAVVLINRKSRGEVS